MNQKEDEWQRILTGALDALKLNEENQTLALQYLNMEAPEDPALLLQAEFQDFSQIVGLEREACLTWCKELKEQAGAEELLARYVRFTAAVGGSSACHVLITRQDLSWLTKWLTKEQTAAFRAELYAYDAATLQQGCLSVLYSMGSKDPEVLARAMELCRGNEDAPKILLAGAYLYTVSLADGEYSSTEKVVADLQRRLLERLPELFGGKVLLESEILTLCGFVRESCADDPLPAELLAILQGKKCSGNLLALLAGCAWLALDHGGFFENFLRLTAVAAMEMKKIEFLPLCRYMADRDWFFSHIGFLLKNLPIPPAVWVEWSLRTWDECVLLYMIKEYPETIKEVAEGMELWDQEQLLERVQRKDPTLAKEMFCLESYRQKAATELVTNFESEPEAARRYFLEEASVEEILPFVKEWRKNGSGYYGNKMTRLERLSEMPDLQTMYRRAVVMEGLLLHGTYFSNYMFTPDEESNQARALSVKELDQLFDLLEKEEVPVFFQLDMLSCIHESLYVPNVQEVFLSECVKALDQRRKAWGEDYKKAAEKASAFTRICCIRTMDLYPAEYQASLLSCASDPSKQVRQVLIEIYTRHKEWEPQIRAMLEAKKQKIRQMAVEVLKEWGIDSYRKELEQLLKKEKSGAFAESLKKLLDAKEEESDLDQLAEGLLKRGRRQKVLWAFTEPFEPIHTTDGREISEAYLQALLICYADGIFEPAKKLAEPLDQAELAACMLDLFGRWLASGAEAKKKWVLYAASIHGGEKIIPLLYQQIKELPGRSRGAMAVEAVNALVQNGSSSALLLVEQISGKFPYRQVKKGAKEALAGAARVLGISQEELEDRLIPDFGFDERMEQRYDYGTRQFTVRLTPALELFVFGENKKRLKNLPAPGKQDDPVKAEAASQAFKQMKKQLKAVIANQKMVLKQALVTGRFWKADRWRALFVKNPVMHCFALGLVWGVYENGVLKQTFRYMEDGSFNTVNEEPYMLPKEGVIGLLHPVELSEAEREAWKEQLLDYEITQPVEQLSRPVYDCTVEEAAKTKLLRFQGKEVNGLSLAGRLTAVGWLKGPVGDGGEYHTFYREDGKTGVELSFSGCGITCENMDVTVYDAVFYEPGTRSGRGESAQIYFLGEIASRYFSEIVLQLTRAVGPASDGIVACENHEKEEVQR